MKNALLGGSVKDRRRATNPSPRVVAAAVLAMTSLSLACGGSSSDSEAGGAPAAPATAAPAPQPPAPPSVPSDAGSTPAPPSAPMCDLGAAPPSLPTFHGKLVLVQPDGGTGEEPPTATGGDEKGLWVFDDLTVYQEASGIAASVDPTKSSIVGQGWIDLKDGNFRFFQQADLSITTSSVGMVVQTLLQKAKGTYAISSSGDLSLKGDCQEGKAGAGTAVPQLSFSRTSATAGLLIIRITGAAGKTTLVATLGIVP